MPVLQLLVSDGTNFPDELDLATDLPIPESWTLDIEQTEHLRSLRGKTRDLAAWNLPTPGFESSGIQVYFREWLGYDLVFELFSHDRSPPDGVARYNGAVGKIMAELLSLPGNPYSTCDLKLTHESEVRLDASELIYPTHYGEFRDFPSIDIGWEGFYEEVKDHWLTLNECRKCGKQDICKFPLDDPDLLYTENRCAVSDLGLQTTLKVGWDEMTKEPDTQALVVALFHYIRIAEEANFMVSRFVSEGVQRWFGASQPSAILSEPNYLRFNQDRLTRALARLQSGHRPKTIFVEGESEELFLHLEMMRGSLSADVVCYGGTGSFRNLWLAVQTAVSKGHDVFIQVDLDGDDPSSFKATSLRERAAKAGAHLFFFDHDFESAFPQESLLLAASSLIDDSLEELKEARTSCQSTKEFLDRVGLANQKVELAEMLHWSWGRAWHYLDRDAIEESQIHKWLRSFYIPSTERFREGSTQED